VESLEDRVVPAVIHVGPTESIKTIAQAALVANNGDDIQIDAGTYTATASLTGQGSFVGGVNTCTITAPAASSCNVAYWAGTSTAIDDTVRNPATRAMLPRAWPIAGPTDTPPQIPDERNPSACERRLSGATSTAVRPASICFNAPNHLHFAVLSPT